MSKDTCIKANTYCPVHKGIVGADCWHDSKDFSVPRTDWKQVDEINTLREQVEKLTKERDSLTSTLEHMEHTRDVEQTRHREMSVATREQLAALAEQNVKLRKALLSACDHIELPYEIGERCAYRKPLSLPDLASPVLNRIRAEGMLMAAEICAQLTTPTKLSDPGRSWINGTLDCEKAIRARAAELENEDAN